LRCSKDKEEQSCPHCKHPSKPCHQSQHVSTPCAGARGDLRHQHPRQSVPTGVHRCRHDSKQHQARDGMRYCEAGGPQKGPCLNVFSQRKRWFLLGLSRPSIGLPDSTTCVGSTERCSRCLTWPRQEVVSSHNRVL
jgi:hypothetical protein